MQKTIQQLEAEYDALIAEFDRVTQGMWNWPDRKRDEPNEYCVAKIIKFPQREALREFN